MLGQPSVTAQRVAAHRLTCDRPSGPFGDAGADDRLSANVSEGVTTPMSEGMARYITARTRFFDHVVLSALDRDVRQIVVAGAGYDARSLRYAKPGVQWFELDHPATQADKRERLSVLGIDDAAVRYVPADFRDTDIGAAMAEAGLDTAARSLMICEGVAVYLERDVLTALLHGLRAVAGEDSTLAISVSISRTDEGTRQRREAFAKAVGSLGEPALTVLTADDAEVLFAGLGWQVNNSTRARAAGLITAATSGPNPSVAL